MVARKRDVKEINLEVTDIKFNEDAMIISWVSDIGWGEYWIGITEYGDLEADSECMDRGDDKSFLKELLSLASDNIVKKVLIAG